MVRRLGEDKGAALLETPAETRRAQGATELSRHSPDLDRAVGQFGENARIAIENLSQRGPERPTPRAPADLAKSPSLLEGVGELTSAWAELDLAASAACAAIESRPRHATRLKLMTKIFERLAAFGFDEADPGPLIDRLVALGVLSRADGGDKTYAIALPAEEVAFKLNDTSRLRHALSSALKDVRAEKPLAKVTLENLLLRCARASEAWPRYPVEARWPFLKAVALLGQTEQDELTAVLLAHDELRHFPLIDSTLLMLQGSAPESWVKRFAPHLEGSAVYTVAAEGWFAAGGLGRVQQYHSAAMKKLTGDHTQVVTIEPYYDRSPQGAPIDYKKLPTPVLDLGSEPTLTFEVQVNGQPVMAQAFRGKNEHGVEVYLIRDAQRKITGGCYSYNKDGNAGWEDFTEFLSRAAAELVSRLEKTRMAESGKAYRPAAIVANDGQAAPLIPWLRQKEQQDPTHPKAALWMVTHTYRNRGIFGGNQGDQLLARWQVKDPFRASFWRVAEADVTSAGIRSADGASAVSAIHRDEMAGIDPTSTLLAITNGDNRAASSRIFRGILRELDPRVDPEHPPPALIRKAKRLAKERLGLNPDQLVIAYSGRLVGEKAGRGRAFTDTNIRALVARGAQVVIYGNVQASSESEGLLADLARLKSELEKEGHPGKLVVRSGWGLEEQIGLLAATDLQVQDSDRKTGAAEYTEADISANAGLQLGPPWLEGIIQRQGVLLDRSRPGDGNTLVPRNGKPESYLEAMLWALETYQETPAAFASYQASSFKISRALEAILTSASYLRELDRVLSKVEQR